MAKRLTIIQPGYLPWLGFFDLIARSDIFVIYDDVQFDKHGWRNRNRIKTANGVIWLTVPVRTKGKGKQKIVDVEIDNRTDWRKKQIDSIRFSYQKAPFFNDYFPEIEKEILKDRDSLLSLDQDMTCLFCRQLGLVFEPVLSSGLESKGKKTERIINICGELGADGYLSTNGAKPYLQEGEFERAGIALDYQDYPHPVYPQLYGEFVPLLSVIDLLFNCGPASLLTITNGALNKL